MKEHEAKEHMARIVKFRELEKYRDEIRGALTKVTEDWKETGPHGQGPFTGNHRESRMVSSMHINFTATRGGAPPVDLSINGMHIEAWELGAALKKMLQAKIDVLNEEIEKL